MKKGGPKDNKSNNNNKGGPAPAKEPEKKVGIKTQRFFNSNIRL